MIEQSAIESRGREMGLRPRRQSVQLGRHGRRWDWIRTVDVRVGDIVAGAGKVHTVTIRGAGVPREEAKVWIQAGEGEPIAYPVTGVVYAFAVMQENA